MMDRLAQIVEEYETLEHQLADPEVLADPGQLRTVSKRYNDLGPVVEKIRRLDSRRGDGEAARQMLDGSSGDERQMLVDEIDDVTAELAVLESDLREMMIPKDPHDGRDVIVEIRGAEGGEEANLFARDLYEMYAAYAARTSGRPRPSLRRSPTWAATTTSRSSSAATRHGGTSSTRVAHTVCSEFP